MKSYQPSSRLSLWMILALILGGCRSLNGIASAPLPNTLPSVPTSTPVVLENGWYLYADSEGEFSFAYPPNALISAGQNPLDSSKNISIQFLLPDKAYQGMSIRVEPNPKQLQGNEIADQLYEQNTQMPATTKFKDSIQTVQVGGLPAVQAVIPGSNTEVTLVIPYAQKVLLASPVHEPSATQVEPEALELFYQILDSMKFASAP